MLDTDFFGLREIGGLRVTDLMQGPVYGVMTDEAALDDRLFPNFHYDYLLGTVVNRFLVRCVRYSAYSVWCGWTNARLFKSEGYTSMCRACLLKPADKVN